MNTLPSAREDDYLLEGQTFNTNQPVLQALFEQMAPGRDHNLNPVDLRLDTEDVESLIEQGLSLNEIDALANRGYMQVTLGTIKDVRGAVVDIYQQSREQFAEVRPLFSSSSEHISKEDKPLVSLGLVSSVQKTNESSFEATSF